MRLRIKLVRREDGLAVEFGHEWADEILHCLAYEWRDNNYSCDCRRDTLFRRALGLPERDTDCGEDMYLCEYIRDEGGTLLYTEFYVDADE